jgi:hypothetical protein
MAPLLQKLDPNSLIIIHRIVVFFANPHAMTELQAMIKIDFLFHLFRKE